VQLSLLLSLRTKTGDPLLRGPPAFVHLRQHMYPNPMRHYFA